MNKLLNTTAFPMVMETATAEVERGFSKREYGAFMIMQGLCSKYSLNKPEDQQVLAQMSQELADTLLIHLEKTKP